MHPEPLIGILPDHRFKGIIEKLGIRFHIFFDVMGMDQLKRFFDQKAMVLNPISNHENR
jgi:hypothetical protein